MALRIRGAAAVVLTAAALTGCAPSDEQVVELTVRHSRFEPMEVRIPVGTTVRFVIRNLDPIDHELIVGPPAVHDRHEEGRERHHHGDVPGEVSVRIGGTAETTYTFGRPGRVAFGCHLPGHWAYGMRGRVVVG